MEVSVDVSQVQVLEDFFNGLSNIDQRKIFLSSFRKAARPLIAVARAGAPQRTGKLRKSIGSVEVPNEIAILVGAKLSGTYKGWHAHFIENGTAERFRRKKGGAPTGKVTATHFFENAYNATEHEMFSNIEKEWHEEIGRAIIRINKKLKK
jgi:HK97 gp10 family phage protein